jgi:hypothetical protein
MADKIKKAKSRYEDDEKHSRRHDDDDDDDFDGGNDSRGRDGGSKYEKLYGVIDAFVDQIDMPRNRTRAIKFGIRALGELLSETNSGGSHRGGSHRRSSGGSHERGVSKR